MQNLHLAQATHIMRLRMRAGRRGGGAAGAGAAARGTARGGGSAAPAAAAAAAGAAAAARARRHGAPSTWVLSFPLPRFPPVCRTWQLGYVRLVFRECLHCRSLR